MSKIELRELNVDDLFVVVGMLLSITGEARDEIAGIVSDSVSDEGEKKPGPEEIKSAADETAKYINVGLKAAVVVLQACFKHCQSDMRKWMGSLIGVTAEEFGKMPIDTPIDIISELKKKEDMPVFFSKAFSLYKELNASAKQSMKK